MHRTSTYAAHLFCYERRMRVSNFDRAAKEKGDPSSKSLYAEYPAACCGTAFHPVTSHDRDIWIKINHHPPLR